MKINHAHRSSGASVPPCSSVVKIYFLKLGLLIIFFHFSLGLLLCQQNIYPLDFSDETSGDSAMAARYALWAKNMLDQGLYDEALAGLERASVFADVSSDISHLLALARSHKNRPRGEILEALNLALAVGRWNMYSPDDARLLKAENFIALRAYPDALAELSYVSKSVREAELNLKALMPSQPAEFRHFMEETLDRYPRESGPVRIFFTFLKNQDAAGRNPEMNDLALLELVIRRLPVLLLKDAELAWMAAPFMRDTAEARRLVMAYRAAGGPAIASLPAALRLGVIDEESALEELFSASKSLDLALLDEVWGLLRREEARALFRRNLSSYSGVLSEDGDRDGIPEIFAEYRGGMPVAITCDTVQGGTPELIVYFDAGLPLSAKTLLPPEAGLSANKGSRKEAAVAWERYPAVLEVELDGVKYIPRPLDLHFAPIKFTELWGSGVLFPRLDPLDPPLTRRSLVYRTLRVERPSLEFSGGIEVVELNQGIPVRAREYVGDTMVSETEFLRGRPQLQRVDLDADGRMDTVRFFKKEYRAVEIEDLWDYDRNIERTVSGVN